MDTTQQAILESLCRTYAVPCSPEQVVSLDIEHRWGALLGEPTPTTFVEALRDTTVVRVKYRHKDDPHVILTAERRDGRWRETGVDYLPAVRADDLYGIAPLQPLLEEVWAANECQKIVGEYLAACTPDESGLPLYGEWVTPPVTARATPNACPHCGHETPPGPRCAVCRRHLG